MAEENIKQEESGGERAPVKVNEDVEVKIEEEQVKKITRSRTNNKKAEERQDISIDEMFKNATIDNFLKF